jgi:8-oxo-dGTP diphosphatase
MALASFIAIHDVDESGCGAVATPAFAVVIARAAAGVVLVFNRYRAVWELPGGLIDPGESPREAARRELLEEAGCTAGNLTWLGLVEVHDGRTHFGAVYRGDVAAVPAEFQSEEIAGIAYWQLRDHPRPLGHTDDALLRRLAQ